MINIVTFAIFSRNTKRTIQAMLGAMRRILDFFIFFSAVIFIYAGIGYRIFNDDHRTYNSDPNYDPHISNYNSYSVIANSLMVLVTSDNYPLVMRPFINQISGWSIAYFMPFIMLNIFFFIPLPIAVVYDGFREKRSELALKDNMKEKEALFACYLTITRVISNI